MNCFCWGSDDSVPQVGDIVEVTLDGKTFWTSKVVKIDDFGRYLCSTWWQIVLGEKTVHQSWQVKKLD